MARSEPNNVTFGIGSKESRIVNPLSKYLGSAPVSAPVFAKWCGRSFADERIEFAKSECERVAALEDNVFVLVSVVPKRDMLKWPIEYELDVFDVQGRSSSFVAIQPSEEFSPSFDKYPEVGLVTRDTGTASFTLMFIMPRAVAESTTSATLRTSSQAGACKWSKSEG